MTDKPLFMGIVISALLHVGIVFLYFTHLNTLKSEQLSLALAKGINIDINIFKNVENLPIESVQPTSDEKVKPKKRIEKKRIENKLIENKLIEKKVVEQVKRVKRVKKNSIEKTLKQSAELTKKIKKPVSQAAQEAFTSPMGPTSPSLSTAKHENLNRLTEQTQPLDTPIITRPTYQSKRPPVYPRRAISRKQEGEVVVEALVDNKGKVLEVDIFKSSGFSLLDKSALKAVKKWLFLPTKRSGVAINSIVRVAVNFQLADAG